MPGRVDPAIIDADSLFKNQNRLLPVSMNLEFEGQVGLVAFLTAVNMKAGKI